MMGTGDYGVHPFKPLWRITPFHFAQSAQEATNCNRKTHHIQFSLPPPPSPSRLQPHTGASSTMLTYATEGLGERLATDAEGQTDTSLNNSNIQTA